MLLTIKGGGVERVAKKHPRMCVQNYSGAQFIAPRQGQMLGPIPDPGPAWDWVVELRGSFMSMNFQPLLLSGN